VTPGSVDTPRGRVLSHAPASSWLYEDALPISRPFYRRLVSLAVEMDERRSVAGLHELVGDGGE
jgi:hypothetical protein